MKRNIHYLVLFLLLAAGLPFRAGAQCSGSSITVSGHILSCSLPMESYQWFRCPSMIYIPGASSNSYYVTMDGDYGLVVKIGTCIDTLACVTVSGLGVETASAGMQLNIFPNPSAGSFRISGAGFTQAILRVTDLLGRMEVLQDIRFDNNHADVQLALPKGHHVISISDGGGRSMRSRILVE